VPHGSSSLFSNRGSSPAPEKSILACWKYLGDLLSFGIIPDNDIGNKPCPPPYAGWKSRPGAEGRGGVKPRCAS